MVEVKPLRRCNKCAKFCDTEHSREDAERGRTDPEYIGYLNESDPNYGLIDAEVFGHYLSDSQNGLDDGYKYTFSLCENCLKILFKNFAIQPEKTWYL